MKKKIVIASVLKPIDDVRAYWKLSQSIAKTNKYEVNIIGNASKKAIHHENITFHPHNLQRTQWMKRIIVREEILWKILKIKPHVLIITTPELLNVAIISKMLTDCQIIYDVQENHYLNATRINPSFFTVLHGLVSRFKEIITRPFIMEYWLAEKCYEKQLRFTKNKSNVVENKAFDFNNKTKKNDQVNVLFSGTISKYSGVDRALKFYEQLIKVRPESTLKIVGQVHDTNLKNRLESVSKNLTGLQLNISLNPIPYNEILEAISSSSLGVIGYEPNLVNAEKVPTKLYEYSRYQLPYLVQSETNWSSIGQVLGGAIPIDFNDFKVNETLKTLEKSNELFPEPYPEEATWEFESMKILSLFNNLNK